jgi:hypothetical protein
VPFACGTTACKTACAVKADCAPGHRCESGICVKEPETTCEPDGSASVRVTNGEREPCAPYRCNTPTGACKTACVTSDDCLSPAICDVGAKACVAAPAAEGDEGGCSVSTAPGRSPGVWTLASWASAALAAGVLRRHAARRRSRGVR